MKFRLMFIIIPIMMFIGCDTDTSGGGESSQPTSKTFAVSNIMFDSLTLDLTADVNLADGTNVTLTCSGKSVQTVVKGGKISLKFASAFTGIMGGKSYTVTFGADGYNTVSGSIAYWPKVDLDLDIYGEITIYNGGADGLVIPKYTLKNYDSDKVQYGSAFYIFDTNDYDSTDDPTSLDIDTSGWKFDDLKTFFQNAANIGKTAEYHFSVTPICNGGDALASGGCVIYHFKAEVLINSVLIDNKSGVYTARLYAEDNASDSGKAETAGGSVAYQWQSSADGSSWNDIAGATAKTFELTSSNVNDLLNKSLRVQVTQTYGGSKQLPIVSPGITVVGAALTYLEISSIIESFTLSRSQLDQPTITITPDLECAEGDWQTEYPNVMYEYTWLIEGTDSSVYKGVQINDETHAIVITKSVFVGDAYHIDCIVRIYNHNDEYDTDLDIGYANMTLDLR